ncbi:MAG: Hsp20 family protein [Kiloniellales bacterium]
MSRTSLFGSPLFLGFEEFERAFERLSKSATDGYPPYNVEQHSESHLRIHLAVAGFSADELSVQLERNQLVIRGKQAPEAERQILYRGIATRQFQRSFVLAEGIEVTGAMLENGLLRIDLDRPLVEPEVRKIEITTGP